MRVLVVGCGSWGTALALHLANNGHEVVLRGRNSAELDEIRSLRTNSHYLPGYQVPDSIAVQETGAGMCEADLGIVAVPSEAVGDVCSELLRCPVVAIASKGFDADGLLSNTVGQRCPDAAVAVLSGPNLAREVAMSVPSVAVAASTDFRAATLAQEALMGPRFRVYVSDDIVGVQVAGAVKNVIAIAAGMSDGLGFGDNTKAAVAARGLNEAACIGLALGARIETFLGVAGVGDLFATASSTLSRNYRLGYGLGEGRDVATVLEEIGQVVEGLPTCHAVVRLAKLHGLSVPITEVVSAVVLETLTPQIAVSLLMERAAKPEWIPPPETS